MRAEGMGRIEAILEAGRVRVRPIMLTSITTFLGISPLIFFATGQTAFLSPMAVSLGFGLLFATGVILIAIPCMYLIADDLRQWSAARVRALFTPAEELFVDPEEDALASSERPPHVAEGAVAGSHLVS